MKLTTYIIIAIGITLMTSCDTKDCIDLNAENNTCINDLLIMQASPNGSNLDYSLDASNKPLATPLTFNNVRTDTQPSNFTQTLIPTNYDAYNSIANTYFIAFPSEDILYKYDLMTATRQQFMSGLITAPIVVNNILYALRFVGTAFPGTTVNFEIVSIDQNTGLQTVLLTDVFTRVSPFNGEGLSSAKDASGNIYFLGGSNLLAYNIAANTASHFDLEPQWNQNNHFVRYSGLEYRNNNNLVAVRDVSSTSIVEPGGDLAVVEFLASNPAISINKLLDLEDNGEDFNPEFYATTYDPCDDMYYITTGLNTNNFLQVNLSNATLTSQTNSNYSFGLATNNQ